MIDPVVETRRQAYIERLYERSGRSCSTYSGLLLEHIQHLLEQDMTRELEGNNGLDH
jgi:hypothetical protein